MEIVVISLIVWLLAFVFMFMDEKYKEKATVVVAVIALLTILGTFLSKAGGN